MRGKTDRRSNRTFALLAPAALTGTRTDVILPLLALSCWILVVLVIIRPRRRRHPPPSRDGWYAPVSGPPSDDPHDDEPPRPEPPRSSTPSPAETRRPRDLPTLDDVHGHRTTVAQLNDLAGPVLDAGPSTTYRRPWGAVLLHGGTPADQTLVIRAIAGEHDVPLLTVRAAALVRSELDSGGEQVITQALAAAPCVLVVADLDEIAAQDSVEVRRMTNDLRTQLARVGPTERVVVVGLASGPGAVPRSLADSGGFDRAVRVGAMTAAERHRMIRRELFLHGCRTDGDLDAAAQVTDGLTATRLRAVVAAAARTARHRTAISDGPPTLTARDLREAVADADAVPWTAPDAFGPVVALHLRGVAAALERPSAGPGLALLGASGNGTTTAARWLAQHCDRPTVWLTGTDIALLLPDDLDAVVDGTIAQAPSLVVIDDVDEVLAHTAAADRKQVVTAAIDDLLRAPGVALVLTARDQWKDLDERVSVQWLAHPKYHERKVLIRHAAPDMATAAVAALAAGLHGATRHEVIDTARRTREDAA